MKRTRFLKHLQEHGCELLREGGRHSWWRHAESGRRAAIPRHSELSDLLCKEICKELGIPKC